MKSLILALSVAASIAADACAGTAQRTVLGNPIRVSRLLSASVGRGMTILVNHLEDHVPQSRQIWKTEPINGHETFLYVEDTQPLPAQVLPVGDGAEVKELLVRAVQKNEPSIREFLDRTMGVASTSPDPITLKIIGAQIPDHSLNIMRTNLGPARARIETIINDTLKGEFTVYIDPRTHAVKLTRE